MWDLQPKELLGLTVLAAVVSTVGTLVALLLKEWFFARSFERWKEQRELEKVYKKYRDPIVLAAGELTIRLKEIAHGEASDYLNASVLKKVPKTQVSNWASDPYYLRYKLESTVFRLCCLFGWLELYRQDVTFLRTSSKESTRKLGDAIKTLREDLADGQLNDAPDFHEWRDHLIFREEQRAIGESMIIEVGGTRQVMGYAEFQRNFRSSDPNPKTEWIQKATEFFMDLGQQERDFRLTRAKSLYVHLVNLIELLEPDQLSTLQHDLRREFAKELPQPVLEGLTSPVNQERVTKALAAVRTEVKAPSKESTLQD